MRSRNNRPKRSMANDHPEMKPLNPQHQERPLNGASIGACIENRNLPPVSFGGLIMVDGKPYGMTVHHMLDENSDAEDENFEVPVLHRSSGRQLNPTQLDYLESSPSTNSDDDYSCDFSDYDSEDSLSATESVDDDEDVYDLGDDEDVTTPEPGDIEGVYPGSGIGYAVTQPAIDDVDEDFFPDEDTREEDHLDTFALGEIYASSGIRRRHDNGTTHEIDWALFEFNEDRLPSRNLIQDGDRFCRNKSTYPVEIIPQASLFDLDVHCMARTSGLQTGHIMPTMVSVKISGRKTPSQSFQVSGSLGIPGDSGAWIVDNEQGRVGGHVLAWSSKKRVAYICPMDVLLRDIAETLDASKISLPGGKPLARTLNAHENIAVDDHSSVQETRPRAGSGHHHVEPTKPAFTVDHLFPQNDDLVSSMNSMRISDVLSLKG